MLVLGFTLITDCYCHRNNSDGSPSALPTFGKLGLGRAIINQIVYIFVYSEIGIWDQYWDDIGASTTFLPQASVNLNTALSLTPMICEKFFKLGLDGRLTILTVQL